MHERHEEDLYRTQKDIAVASVLKRHPAGCDYARQQGVNAAFYYVNYRVFKP